MSFIRLDPQDIAISAESVVAPLWSTGNVELSNFVTSSDQVSSNTGNYFYDVYQTGSSLPGAEVQFSIAYGNKNGLGTQLYNSQVPNNSPTSTIFGQYRNLVLADEDTDFIFGQNASDSIYIVALNRSRYKEKLFTGTFNLTLTKGAQILELTDDSLIASTVSYVDAGRVFNIISGSNGVAGPNTGLTATNSTYGKYLPDVGIIILNGDALDSPASGVTLGTDLAQTGTENNPGRLYNALVLGDSFILQSEETITSTYVYVRARNAQLNYSTNPSNITGSGELRHDIMINSPQAYITSVGLYNDSNDLVAVAKLSRPLLKDFTTEALLRIKLDY